MPASEAAQQAAYGAPPFVATARPATPVAPGASRLAALSWAGLASTLHRLRRGEGALLAVNLSLVAYLGPSPARGLAQALVSALAIAVMYAFNDLYDAPTDWNNPKKDRTLIATYREHRRAGALALLVLHLLTVAIALAALGPGAAAAVAAVMLVNLIYSMALKGVPVVDVAWCGLWGALYAAIVDAPASLLVVVALMTSVCHLFQTLDDRVADADNGITTTAVRSAVLSRNVLLVISLLLFIVLLAPLGAAWAVTAFIPLMLFFTSREPRIGWLLTKGYFGVMWLRLLGSFGAVG